MDVFADINQNSVLEFIAIMLLMAIFGCAVAVLDHWVWAGRSDSPPKRTCYTRWPSHADGP
jgi:hypothetical protein